MRYVKSAEEMERLRALYAAPQFLDATTIGIGFETTAEAVRALLPPPLEPAGRPLGNVWIGSIGGSNCVGPFMGAGVTVRARYGDLEGAYCVTMPMSTDIAIIFGRELYGEPKKQADIRLERDGNRVTATVSRYGVTYIEVGAELAEDVPADGEPRESSNFYYKYLPRADGLGFEFPPVLVRVRQRSLVRRARRGAGRLVFRESPHDPVADIPIVRTFDAAWTEGETHTFGETLAEVDAEAFLPYAWGKTDALDLLGAVGRQGAGASAEKRPVT